MLSDPFHELMNEHRVIEKVLKALVAAADQDMPRSFYERAIDFIAVYADSYHHEKEEVRLFPYLGKRGFPQEYGPIAVMLQEHIIARGHVSAMRELLAAGDVDGLRRESLAYAALLTDHIQKEDNVLYPAGRRVLRHADLKKLGQRFADVEEPEGGAEAYVLVARELLAEVEGA